MGETWMRKAWRRGDMDSKSRLTIGQDHDGDVHVTVYELGDDREAHPLDAAAGTTNRRRQMTWQFKSPKNGRIDGKTPAEWERAGVRAWMMLHPDQLYRCRDVGAPQQFADMVQYAPATAEMLPAPWPDLWQWRKLEAEMDERTWHAVARWNYGDRRVDGPRPVCTCDGDSHNVAHEGEWWAPADQDGNPCDWPDLEPQPVVVIPAAEMTPLVLHGHRALDGTWRWRHVGEEWSESDVGDELWVSEEDDDADKDIEWAPCNERGDFCELRRVVAESGWVRVAADRVEDARRERDELAKELAEARQDLARYRGGVASMAAEMEELLSAGPEVDNG